MMDGRPAASVGAPPLDVALAGRSIGELARWVVRSRVLAAVASGALYAAAFPPLGEPALAWVALVPLLVASANGASLVVAAACGLLFGLVACAGLIWWMPGMVAAYFGLPLVAGWSAFLAIATGLAAIYPAAFGLWVAWLVRRGRAAPLVVAAGWTAVELARARLFVGNPWGLLGYSQTSWPHLVQIADLCGPYGTGFVVAAVNVTLAAWLVPALRGRRYAWSCAGVALLLVATVVYGEVRLRTAFGDGPAVRVAVVQGAAPRETRRGAEARAGELDRLATLTRGAMAERPALVVWPENAIDVDLEAPSYERDLVLGLDRELGVDLVIGAPTRLYTERGVRWRNSVHLVRGGLLAGRYDKLHLMPIAERAIGAETYEPGQIPTGLRTRSGLMGALVCFEAMYPELVRTIVAGGVEMLANLSNDAWFGHATPAEQHLDMAALRAVETRRWLVRAATTGVSAIVDPWGRVVARIEFGRPGVISGEIRRSHAETVYQTWGDAPAWGAVGLALAASLGRRRTKHSLKGRPT